MRLNYNALALLFLTFFAYGQTDKLTTQKLQIADSLIKAGEKEKSIDIIDQLIAAHPEGDSIHNLLKAERLYIIAVTEPDNLEAVKLCKKLLALTKSYKVKNITKLLRKTYTEYYINLGHAGKWEQALKVNLQGYNLFSGYLKGIIKANYIYDMAYLYDKQRNYSQAIQHYRKSITLMENIEDPKYYDIALAYNNLALTYGNIGFFTEIIKNYNKARYYWEEVEDNTPPSYLITIYNNLILTYIEYGDIAKAEGLLPAFDELIAQTSDKKPKQLVRSFYVYNKLNAAKNNCQNVLNSIDKMRRVFKSLPPKSQQGYNDTVLSSMTAGVECLIKKKEYQTAQNLLDEAFVFAKNYCKPHLKKMLYAKRAKLASVDHDYATAITHTEQALKLNEQSYSEVSEITLTLSKAIYQEKSGQNKQARSSLKKAFTVLPTYNSKHPVTKLALTDFKNRNSEDYIKTLTRAAEVHENLYQKEQLAEDAMTALHLYKLAAGLFEQYYLKGHYNPNLDELNRTINQGLLKMHIALGFPIENETINLVINNGSQHLRKEFLHKHLQRLSIPDSIFTERNLLLEEKAYYLTGIGAQDSLKTQKKVTEITTALDNIHTEIESIDPTYLSFFEDKFDISQTQSNLQQNQLIVQYITGTDEVFALTIDPEHAQFFSLGNRESIFKDVEALYQGIQNRNPEYSTYATLLYEQLIAPFENTLAKKDELIIIPQGKLNYLLFETLIDPNTNTPIVSEKAVTYTHSAQLWDLQTKLPESESKGKQSLIAFAPQYESDYTLDLNKNAIVFSDDNRLLDLQGAQQEAQSVTTIFSGALFENSKATKEQFLSKTEDYKIYHLAMHSLLDQDNYEQSHLVFQNEQPLYYKDLYNLHFPAELVVLSACNTGIGQLKQGEGLMGLSKALTYAGVKSSVYSLWQVPDKATSEIMVSFYSHLKDGESKSEALAQSKRDFIENNPMKAHPFFWAGFVLNGNNEAISFVLSPTVKYLLYGGLTLFLLLLFIFIRRKKSE